MDEPRAGDGLLASGRRHLANSEELIATSAELIAKAASLRLWAESARSNVVRRSDRNLIKKNNP
jgi:hypothetical protein